MLYFLMAKILKKKTKKNNFFKSWTKLVPKPLKYRHDTMSHVPDWHHHSKGGKTSVESDEHPGKYSISRNDKIGVQAGEERQSLLTM